MLKYLIIRSSKSKKEYAVLYPVGLVHSSMASLYVAEGQTVISAGFCIIGKKVEVFGGSDTLNMESRPIDAEIIRRDFSMPDGSSEYAAG